MVRPMIAEELAKVKATVTAQGEDTASYDQAAVIFDKMSLTPDSPEFPTLPLRSRLFRFSFLQNSKCQFRNGN
jgi:malate synthase